MSRHVWSSLVIVLVCGPLAGPAFAQESAAQPPQAALGMSGGLAAASQGNGAVLGARLGFGLTDRLAIEGNGSYIGRGRGADAISANVSLIVSLAPRSSKTMPYVAIGGGVYHASFDLDHGRFLGGLAGRYPAGTHMVPISGTHGFGMMQGPYTGPERWMGSWQGEMYVPGQMPRFYADRLGHMTVPADGRWGMRSFTDPALSIGGGVRLDVSPRFYVQPDARALVVLANGASHTVGVLSLGIGYRF